MIALLSYSLPYYILTLKLKTINSKKETCFQLPLILLPSDNNNEHHHHHQSHHPHHHNDIDRLGLVSICLYIPEDIEELYIPEDIEECDGLVADRVNLLSLCSSSAMAATMYHYG